MCESRSHAPLAFFFESDAGRATDYGGNTTHTSLDKVECQWKGRGRPAPLSQGGCGENVGGRAVPFLNVAEVCGTNTDQRARVRMSPKVDLRCHNRRGITSQASGLVPSR